MSVGGMIYLWITVLWSRLVVFRCFHVCSGFLEVLINHMLWDDGEVGRCCQGLEYTSISSSKLEWPIYNFSIKKWIFQFGNDYPLSIILMAHSSSGIYPLKMVISIAILDSQRVYRLYVLSFHLLPLPLNDG